MRRFVALFAPLAVLALTAAYASADTVEVKGPHLCCGQCVKVAEGLLAKVDGVSDAKADQKTKTITFTAKDEAAAKAGLEAIYKGGFAGKATRDGKELKIKLAPIAKGDKVAKVIVKDVHVCCGQCVTGVKGLFKDSKVSIEGKGAQRTVIVEGENLTVVGVVQALRKGGFNGTPEK
ncbi:MAG TPA: heavy metal-associated domain-containing protein [Gemmataceae bacterium]|nr:heavy metal-associated domain-containing protein [Gemmataceae bacterium]